jgi:virulence-associated protein VagC
MKSNLGKAVKSDPESVRMPKESDLDAEEVKVTLYGKCLLKIRYTYWKATQNFKKNKKAELNDSSARSD